MLIRKYGLLWFRHPGLPWSHSLFKGSWILAFSTLASDCQNLSLAYENTWTHTPPHPRQAICSSLVQFSFPFRDILFGPFSTITLKNASQPKMMFIEIDSLWESGFPVGLTESSTSSSVTVTTHNYMVRDVSCCSPVWWSQKWGPWKNFSN